MYALSSAEPPGLVRAQDCDGSAAHFGPLERLPASPSRSAAPSVENPMKRASAITRRKVLCVFPRYTKSFGTFDNAYPIMGVKAFMPPQGILVIANYHAANIGTIRFVDENHSVARHRQGFCFGRTCVFVSGMHIQRVQMNDINRRAHAPAK